MKIWDKLLGRSDTPKRFFSEADHAENLERQTRMCAKTVEQLRGFGVTPEKALRLEYFFYTDAEDKGRSLLSELSQLGYEVTLGKVPDDDVFVVTGWTSAMPMQTDTVVGWVRQMCELGFAQDAEFDGWGTNPNQD